jgi:hypothetical protein
MKPPVPTEDQEAAALAGWLDAHNILYCHVPNGGFRNVREAVKFKRIGVKKGVPDFLLFDKPRMAIGNKVGVAIELKRTKGGVVSLEQKIWLDCLSGRGWISILALGADEAIVALKDLGYGRRVAE